MAQFESAQIANLLVQIADDLEAAASMASAAAASAGNDARAGRTHDAFQRILDAEPQIHHATKLVSIATYVVELDRGDRSDKA